LNQLHVNDFVSVQLHRGVGTKLGTVAHTIVSPIPSNGEVLVPHGCQEAKLFAMPNISNSSVEQEALVTCKCRTRHDLNPHEVKSSQNLRKDNRNNELYIVLYLRKRKNTFEGLDPEKSMPADIIRLPATNFWMLGWVLHVVSCMQLEQLILKFAAQPLVDASRTTTSIPPH
jgi:hypothetical protein